MQKILCLLCILVLWAVSAQASSLQEEVNAYLSGLVRLVPKSQGINLRSGPGTDFEIIGQTHAGLSFLASPDTIEDAEGKAWHKIAYNVERQEDTGYFEQDPSAYIRSDLVRLSPLTDMDKERVASHKFRILTISPKGLPHFTLEQPLVLMYSCFAPSRVEIPAGTPLLLFATIFLYENTAYLPVYEAYSTSGIHKLGDMKLADFEALSFGAAEENVRAWLQKNRPRQTQ